MENKKFDQAIFQVQERLVLLSSRYIEDDHPLKLCVSHDLFAVVVIQAMYSQIYENIEHYKGYGDIKHFEHLIQIDCA